MRPNSTSVRAAAGRVAAASLLAATIGCGRGVASASDSAPLAASEGATTTVARTPGEEAYQRCVPCHLDTGLGVPGSYPPLVGANLATAKNPTAAIRIMFNGLQGPTTVNGASYNALMPPYGTNLEMSDAEIADVLTYIRQAWGNAAGPVSAEQVAKERAASPPTGNALTAAALAPLL